MKWFKNLIIWLVIIALYLIIVWPHYVLAYDIGEDNSEVMTYRGVRITGWNTITYWQRYAIIDAVDGYRDFYNFTDTKIIKLKPALYYESYGWSYGYINYLYNFNHLGYNSAMCLVDHELTEKYHPRPIKGPNHSWEYIYETCAQPLPSNNERFK